MRSPAGSSHRARAAAVAALAATAVLVLGAAPLAAQFAPVPRPPALVPFDFEFTRRDTVPAGIRAVRDSAARASARASLRAWVDSAAGALDVRVDVADSLRLPADSARPRPVPARPDSTPPAPPPRGGPPAADRRGAPAPEGPPDRRDAGRAILRPAHRR